MTAPPSTPESSPPGVNSIRWSDWLAVGALLLAIIAAYHNSIYGPFTFDDFGSVQYNQKLHQFTSALFPSNHSGLAGRPVASLTFALNHALDGENVEGYHVINVAIHLAAALVLMAVLRRSLLLPRLASRFGAGAQTLAFAIALLWALHPLQTESVNYIIQRTESLMGLCYLLTLYGFIRGAQAGQAGGWWVFASVTCLLGAGSKEIIATAPLLIFLYDGILLSGSWRAAWREHRAGYLGLALTWLVIAGQVFLIDRGNVGAGYGVSRFDYALTSCRSLMLYLKLSLWPHPLILDYGIGIVHHLREVWPQALGVIALTGATLCGLWRRSPLGLAGAWFLFILAPVSSVIPVLGQPTAEHRVYLSLAAVITVVVLALHALLGRLSLVICGLLALGCGWLTVHRNEDYRTTAVLWADTVAKCPLNARAHLNHGSAISATNTRDAVAEYRKAIALDPDYAEPHLALGMYCARDPAQHSLAIAEYQAAVRIRPTLAGTHVALGNLYFKQPGQFPRAVAEYRAALRLDPDAAEVHHNLANALKRLPAGHDEAIREYQTALRLNPNLPEVHFELANTLADEPGQFAEAAQEFEAALRLKPDYLLCHYNYALLLAHTLGHTADAIAHYEAAIRQQTTLVPARYNLGRILSRDRSRIREAIAHFEAILKLEPDHTGAQRLLEKARASLK